MAYQPQIIEKKWQDYWVKNKIFKAQLDPSKEKLYILDMFPYPSGDGLHVGHIEGYTATDIYSRFKRMQGFNVLHTIGWDAFGLPAEQYAIRTGQHPSITTSNNIANFKQQIQAMGFSYDWDRELTTCDPKYYKWTQWIFLQLYHKGLAYQDQALVNWCPELKAVLANEEVVDGYSEIGGHPVIRLPLRQWMLKITAYAQRLLDDLAGLDWPSAIIEMQRNWIGKSQGANCIFKIADSDLSFVVYTTRPDTLFGATYCVLAPEHPLISKITTKQQQDTIDNFLNAVKKLSDRERINEGNEKFGAFTGAYAINPINGEKVPIWIADYVLYSYGTGAIMAVPAHDSRDYDFAKKYNLPIKVVIESSQELYSGEGKLINSGFLEGMDSTAARKKVIEYLQDKKLGKQSTNFKLRDWIFSRQRYWGEPIPILLDGENNTRPLSEQDLPLELPAIASYEPTDNAQSPLQQAEDWLKVNLDNKQYTRETNTMPQWAGSCWYYLRFADPHNDQQAFSKEAEKYWLPVDLYVGGAEHAVLHLMYARFWHKVLYDLGLVSTKEPFKKLINQGMIVGEDGQKMSKSRGNVVSPSSIIDSYGADSLRLYEMFMGPLEKSKPWQSGAIDGVYRFLNKVWNLIIDENTNQVSSRIVEDQAVAAENKLLHTLIVKITSDCQSFKFNTCVSAFMIFLGKLSEQSTISIFTVKSFLALLNPFAPHLAEELWSRLNFSEELSYYPWPKADDRWLVADQVTIPVQINGKTRGKLEVSPDTSSQELLDLAKQHHTLAKYLQVEPKKIIYVPQRIINFIIP